MEPNKREAVTLKAGFIWDNSIKLYQIKGATIIGSHVHPNGDIGIVVQMPKPAPLPFPTGPETWIEIEGKLGTYWDDDEGKEIECQFLKFHEGDIFLSETERGFHRCVDISSVRSVEGHVAPDPETLWPRPSTSMVNADALRGLVESLFDNERGWYPEAMGYRSALYDVLRCIKSITGDSSL